MLLNSRKWIFIITLLFGLLSVSTINANEIPDFIEYQGSKLTLNGQGTRVIFFMKVYDGSLYLENQSSDAKEIMNDNTPMAIRIDVTSTMVTACLLYTSDAADE